MSHLNRSQCVTLISDDFDKGENPVQPLDTKQLKTLGASPELVKFLTDKTPVVAPAPAAHQTAFDAEIFKTDNRIHADLTSILTHDHFLVVHPGELKPENAPRLAEKIFTHYTIPEPHFFSIQPQSSIALLMSSFIPVSLDVEKEKLLKDLQALYEKSKTGEHPKLTETKNRYSKPYAAHMKRWGEAHEKDPVGQEYMQHALASYLLMEEAFKRPPISLTEPLASYVKHLQSPDSLIANLCTHLNIEPHEFEKASMEKGVQGIADLLKIDAATTTDIQAISAHAAQNNFPQNMIESWKEGRKQDTGRTLSIPDVLQLGVALRIKHTMATLQNHSKAKAALRKETGDLENAVVVQLGRIPAEVQEAFFLSGGEIIASADNNVGKAFGGHSNALGLHLHASYEPGKTNGIRQVYISRTQEPAERDRYLFHEVHHMVFPEQMSPESVMKIDDLMDKGATRLRALNQELKNWEEAKTPDEKRTIEARIEAGFAAEGITLSKALGEKERDPMMRRLRENVNYALKNFDPHSKELARGYVVPELRAAEIISRYAELRFSMLKDQPDMLNFIAPEMKEVYEQHYLPHVRKEIETLKAASADTSKPSAGKAAVSLSDYVASAPNAASPPQTIVATTDAETTPLKGVPAAVISELQKIQKNGTFVSRAAENHVAEASR